MNPHLHTKPTDPQKNIQTSDTIVRNPPRIHRFQQDVRSVLQMNHGFSDAIFESLHFVHYTHHIVRTIKKQPSGFFRIINAYSLWGNGYYHFLTEVLPSVISINKPYTIHCMESSFAIPVFRWFSISNNVSFEKPTFVNVKESLEQPYIECGNPSTQKIQLLRDQIRAKVTFSRKLGIIIFRKEPVRAILNHDQVLEMLKRVFPDLEWKTFNTLSIDSTAELFSQAAIIVGPHGAGFTNMIFSDSGIRIIEFMPVEKPNLCYWHMAELLHNRYEMIPCHTVNGNFHIDIENVESILTNYIP